LDGAQQGECPAPHVATRNAVGDVDDVGTGRDPLDHAVDDTDELVYQSEVAEKGDGAARHGRGAYRRQADDDPAATIGRPLGRRS